MGFVKVLIGIGLIAIGFLGMNRAYKLSSSSIDAEATVISTREHTCGARRNRHTCYEHALTANGHNFTVNFTDDHAPGSTVQIHYLPNDPSTVEAGPASRDTFSAAGKWLFLLIPGGFFLFSGLSRSKQA